MQLDEFFNYKNKFMDDILSDDSIVKLINNKYSISNSANLVYKQVFPYEYVPETVEEGKTIICIDVDIMGTTGKMIYLPTIFVWVFTHKSLLRLPEGGVRTDKLCSKICEKLNGSMFYGLGELELYSVKRFAPMTDFNGKCMTFHAKDISRFHDPNKPKPANRKNGI